MNSKNILLIWELVCLLTILPQNNSISQSITLALLHSQTYLYHSVDHPLQHNRVEEVDHGVSHLNQFRILHLHDHIGTEKHCFRDPGLRKRERERERNRKKETRGEGQRKIRKLKHECKKGN